MDTHVPPPREHHHSLSSWEQKVDEFPGDRCRHCGPGARQERVEPGARCAQLRSPCSERGTSPPLSLFLSLQGSNHWHTWSRCSQSDRQGHQGELSIRAATGSCLCPWGPTPTPVAIYQRGVKGSPSAPAHSTRPLPGLPPTRRKTPVCLHQPWRPREAEREPRGKDPGNIRTQAAMALPSPLAGS